MKNSLKFLLRDYILREDANQNSIKGKPVEQTSIDDQIDKFFISYEKEAKKLKEEGFNLRSITRDFLFEAGEDEEEEEGGDEEEDAEGDDAEAEEGAGDEEEGEGEEPEKLTIDDIDVNNFASSIVRLIDNYDKLLEVRDTIIRRSKEFLRKNYSEDVVTNYLDVMEEEYDITPGVSDVDKKFELSVPNARGAGPSPGGGG